MKYKGETLNNYFKQYSDSNLIYIIYQLLQLLNSLYSQNIIHNDIKPNNITVDSDLNVYLIDWGAFNIYSRYDRESLGTRNYEAPEAYYTDSPFIDGINDVYRLGITILSLYDSGINKKSEGYFLKYYSDSKNIRLNTDMIKNIQIKNLVDQMIIIDHNKRPYASQLLEESIFDLFKIKKIFIKYIIIN